jgi:serine/threonine-protein kinase
VIAKEEGVTRDLIQVELDGVEGVMPVLQDGEDSENVYIVMPLATGSMRDLVNSNPDGMTVEEVKAIGRTLAITLAGLSGDIVHRDLKPENVLDWNEDWYLTDFGIARYADVTTSDNTLKLSKTAPYAAPEQWREERATSATDVYALGIILFELATGRRPFEATTAEEIREMHLHVNPDIPDAVAPQLKSVIEQCLIKAAGARPSASRIVSELSVASPGEGSPLNRFAQANANLARERSEQEAIRSAKQTSEDQRVELKEPALLRLSQISSTLRDALTNNLSEGVLKEISPHEWEFLVGEKSVELSNVAPVPAAALTPRGSDPIFDVIVEATIVVHKPADRSGYQGRAASLWYCDAVEEGVYDWYETAFMAGPFSGYKFNHDPTGLSVSEAKEAFSKAIGGKYQVAWPFTLISSDIDGEFITRWLNWFADALDNRLNHPSQMPEKPPHGSWRQ